MDDKHIELISKAAATGSSRRTLLKLIATGIVSTVASAIGTSVPSASAAPTLRFPWTAGEEWFLLQGPHAITTSGAGPRAALDLAPKEVVKCTPGGALNASASWVVAAASGKIVKRNGSDLEIAHETGNQGLRTGYSHLSNIPSSLQVGTCVKAGQQLGHPSCAVNPGGATTGVHLHFYVKRGDEPLAIDGINISGWTVKEDSGNYNGRLIKGSDTRTAKGGVRCAPAGTRCGQTRSQLGSCGSVRNDLCSATAQGSTCLKITGDPVVKNITHNSATITWKTDQAASGRVRYDLSTALSLSKTETGGSTTSHSVTLTSLRANRQYYFVAESWNASGGVDAKRLTFGTKQAPTAPAAPSNFKATALDDSRIHLNWIDNSFNEAGFRIKSGDTVIATLPANTTNYIVERIPPGTNRCYQIQAFNNLGNSSWSSSSCAKTIACLKETLVDVSARSGWQAFPISWPCGTWHHYSVVSGEWSHNGVDFNNGDGINYVCAQNSGFCSEPLPTFRTGGLLAAISTTSNQNWGPPSAIGHDTTIPVSCSATSVSCSCGNFTAVQLGLRINEGSVLLGNNVGTLKVRVCEVPAPVTAAGEEGYAGGGQVPALEQGEPTATPTTRSRSTTPTSTPTEEPQPTATPPPPPTAPTETAPPTEEPSPTATATATATPTSEPTETPEPTATDEPEPTATNEPTVTPTTSADVEPTSEANSSNDADEDSD